MSLLPSAGGPSSPPTNESAPNVSTEASAPTEVSAPTDVSASAETSGSAAPAPSVEAPKGDTSSDSQPEEPIRSAASLLMPTTLSLLSIGIVLWLVYAWSGYSTKYSQATDSWKLNSTKMIEITVVREDRDNLSCASDVTVGGLHCGFHANQQPWGGGVSSDSQVLQPFNTVANELFLGAGLWTSPRLPKTLPSVRFTVMCNYKVYGAAKSMSLRWALPPKGSFDPLKTSVAVGALSDCVIPE
jgi:hypothetical protein